MDLPRIRETLAAALRDRPNSPFPNSYRECCPEEKRHWQGEAERALDCLGEIAARGVRLERMLVERRLDRELHHKRSCQR